MNRYLAIDFLIALMMHQTETMIDYFNWQYIECLDPWED